MNSKLIEVNANSTLQSILDGKPSGQGKKFVVDVDDTNKSLQIAQAALGLSNKLGVEVYTSVNIPYGSRSKRIEIVFIYNETVFLTKLTNSIKCDASALELQDLIKAYSKTNPNIKVRGLVLVEGIINQFNTETFIKAYVNHVIIHPVSVDLDEVLDGVFNKSSTSG